MEQELHPTTASQHMKRVTGIGGIFFTAKGDHKELMAWYQKHLGLEETPGQGVFWNWNGNDRPYGQTIFSIFKGDTQYLQPSQSGFMINFRVADMEGLLKTLQEEGVEQVGEMESYDFGKFAWILDPEGNKIELWEPSPGNEFPGGMDME